MIEYPPDFPPAARNAVERAIAEAEQDDSGAVSFVLGAFEVFVSELTHVVIRQPREWTAERLRSQTTGFLDRLIDHAYTTYPHSGLRTRKTSLLPGDISYVDPRSVIRDMNSFRSDVYQELRKYPFWKNLQQKILTLAGRGTASPTTNAEIAAHSARMQSGNERDTLGRRLDSYRLDCGWSIAQLASKLEVEESTVKNHLADKARPHPQTLRKYVDLFNAELRLSPPIRVSDLIAGNG